MTTVGITGANGFLGWHIRCRLHAHGVPSRPATRATFASENELASFVSDCDLIVHAAGVNRNNDTDDIVSGNRWLADRLISAMEVTGKWRPLIYMNSTQSESDSRYGLAKQDAALRLAEALAAHDAAFVNLILPHLFGEYGRPNYNSAVTTFAHALATGAHPEINADGRLELLHAQDVAEHVLSMHAKVSALRTERSRLAGTSIGIPDAWSLLERQYNRYVVDNTVPAFASRFELRMFNMLRSQLDSTGFYSRPIALHSDHRGAFAELCRSDGTSQTSISTSMPGVARGDHFHFDKVERFIVVAGSASIRLRRLFTNSVREFFVSGTQPVFIDMPPMVTHNITNNSSNDVLITVFWAGDHFDPEHPDTYAEPVSIRP